MADLAGAIIAGAVETFADAAYANPRFYAASLRTGGVEALKSASYGHFLEHVAVLAGFSTVYSPPAIGTPSPAPGAVTAQQSLASISITDAHGLQDVTILVQHSNGKIELVYDLASGLAGPEYPGSGITPTSAGGHIIVVSGSFPRSPGWPSAGFIVYVSATNEGGARATASFSYTVSNPDLSAPVFDLFSPAKGGTVAVTGTVTFRAYDVGGAVSQLSASPVIVYVKPDGTKETVYDGAAFQAPFAAGSTRLGAFAESFSIVRAGGWLKPQAVLELVATDLSGNQLTDLYEFNITNAAPIIGNFSPSTGASIPKQQAISFDVTDDSGLFRRIIITIAYLNGTTEVIYDGGFVAPYAASSTSASISNGLHFSLSRGAWLDSFTLTAIAIDQQGSETASTSYQITVTDPPPGIDTIAPVIGAFDPLPGTPIARDQAVTFNVTDDSGFFRRVIVIAAFPNGSVEVVHDGDHFRGFYALTSSRTGISGGFHFLVQRANGWPGSPTLTAYAIDAQGNEAT